MRGNITDQTYCRLKVKDKKAFQVSVKNFDVEEFVLKGNWKVRAKEKKNQNGK